MSKSRITFLYTLYRMQYIVAFVLGLFQTSRFSCASLSIVDHHIFINVAVVFAKLTIVYNL
jgi:hypothetical protein